MSPEEALKTLARPGWSWSVYSTHHDFLDKPSFHILGGPASRDDEVSIQGHDLAALVAEAKLRDWNPYADKAA